MPLDRVYPLGSMVGGGRIWFAGRAGCSEWLGRLIGTKEGWKTPTYLMLETSQPFTTAALHIAEPGTMSPITSSISTTLTKKAIASYHEQTGYRHGQNTEA
jgi:hypothetical protein